MRRMQRRQTGPQRSVRCCCIRERWSHRDAIHVANPGSLSVENQNSVDTVASSNLVCSSACTFFIELVQRDYTMIPKLCIQGKTANKMREAIPVPLQVDTNASELATNPADEIQMLTPPPASNDAHPNAVGFKARPHQLRSGCSSVPHTLAMSFETSGGP